MPSVPARLLTGGLPHGALKQPCAKYEGILSDWKKVLSERSILSEAKSERFRNERCSEITYLFLCEKPSYVEWIVLYNAYVALRTKRGDRVAKGLMMSLISCILSEKGYMMSDTEDAGTNATTGMLKIGFKHFDGSSRMSANEFLTRFGKLCEANPTWTDAQKAEYLKDMCTGKAYDYLATVRTCDNMFATYVRELRNQFGISCDKAVAMLRGRVLQPEENVHGFAKDLRMLMDAIIPFGCSHTKSAVLAALFYWPALKQTDAIRTHAGLWQSAKESHQCMTPS